MCALTINNKPLVSSFDFAIATQDKNWEEIFKNLALQEDEIARVSGTAHAIAVRRKIINILYTILITRLVLRSSPMNTN